MIDITTNQPLYVSTDGTVGPYIMTPASQLADLCRVLDERQVPYTVEEDVISLDGGPEVAVVDLGRAADAGTVQAILDGVG